MKKNKAPPKKWGRAQTKRPNSPVAVAPVKPGQPTRTTKASLLNNPLVKKKTRRLVMRNRRVFKDICRIVYRDLLFVAKGVVWTAVKHHDEIIQVILLLLAMFLEYHVHAWPLLHH